MVRGLPERAPRSSQEDTAVRQKPRHPWRDAPIQWKLGLASVFTVISSVYLTGLVAVQVAGNNLRQQLTDQATSELATLQITYNSTLRQDKLGFGSPADDSFVEKSLRTGRTSERLRQILQSETTSDRRKVELVVLVNREGRILETASSTVYGEKYDPVQDRQGSGVVQRAIATSTDVWGNDLMTVQRLEVENPELARRLGEGRDASSTFLVNYIARPVIDGQGITLGAIVYGNVLDIGDSGIVTATNRALNGGFSGVFIGKQLALGSLLIQGSDEILERRQVAESRTLTALAERPLVLKPSEESINNWEAAGGSNNSPAPSGTAITGEFEFGGKVYTLAAAPILNRQGQPVGALVRGTPQENLNLLLERTTTSIVLGGVLLAVLGSVFSQLVGSGTVTTPLKKLEQAAKSYAEGDLSERAEVESRDEFGTLADVFNQMAEGVAQRQAELLAAKAEVEEQNNALQEEVEHLLDIVSEIEDGNLTVQARVSTQATGLIADTLNRLSEQLGIILATVLSTSRDVTFNAEGLEKLAVAVAENAQQQVQSVVQASHNLESITKLALVASEQASEADLAVGSAQEAVSSGRQEIVNLTSGIEQLQRGTEQMVARVKSLGEFLDLAKQFVQDQKRLASLTQVLAMNASMVAARAVEQREPDQFASVAREFEAIAAQVNNLASRTSEGLLLLQQRTGFIEIVVSGIRQDIEGLTGLVSNFSQSVEQSNDAFENIRLVTERVARVGSAVTESSREIANAIRQSFASVREIEAIAERSAEQAKFTRERSAEMGAMSRQLLQEVEYFRLPPEKLAAVGIDVVATRVEEELVVLR